MKSVREIELLAPARDVQVGVEAIKHGADAVYIGPSRFGARAQAGNSVDDIGRLCDFAHQYDARVYATVNTIVFDHELHDVERLIHALHGVGVDALIVQDMGILRLDLPPIALHASTQCDLRTPAKARFLEAVGFSQLVMARELSLQEIKAIRDAVSVPLEGFVHGALCVSYSGRCQVSQACRGRSANRGECAQFCRLPWDLTTGDGRTLLSGKHLLSLRDFNASALLCDMIDAGVSSFKIEGRLKDAAYVKNVVAHYSQTLDRIIAGRSDMRRASVGESRVDFTPSLVRSFNRSFTTYFLAGKHQPNGTSMASIHTPKSMGEPVGTVLQANGKEITLKTTVRLVNGDGLSYLTPDGVFGGFRVNRVEGNVVTTREAVKVPRGAMVFRTGDKAFADVLARDTARRTVAVTAQLRMEGKNLTLTLVDERGVSASRTVDAPDLSAAQTPQGERQRAVLAKLGDTAYRLTEAHVLDDMFVPASVLTRLRREAVVALDAARSRAREVGLRRPEQRDYPYVATALVSADNVANHLAAAFYRDHGVERIAMAMECDTAPVPAGTTVMHTRYCLRRELGACRKEKGAQKLPETLLLRSGDVTLQVECDCARCEMLLKLQ